jgi:hypothetical protein
MLEAEMFHRKDGQHAYPLKSRDLEKIAIRAK